MWAGLIWLSTVNFLDISEIDEHSSGEGVHVEESAAGFTFTPLHFE